MAGARYSAFISYNQRDRRWASWLHHQLETYRFPKAIVGRDGPLGTLGRRLPPVYQDREEGTASPDLAESIRDALVESSSLIVLCSTAGAGSRWVNDEVRMFLELGRRDRIRCMIVPEADDAHRMLSPAEIFPPALLAGGAEPLAADIRRGGDAKRAAILKLIAGISGVRYDDLRQRDLARRQKRLIWLATASAAGFIAMSALAIFALIARAEAVRERDVARQKTVTAQRTTAFVKGLFAVSDPSSARGEKITALDVLDRGSRQIRGALENEPDVRAELATTLSEVYLGLGSYRRADDLLAWSLQIPTDDSSIKARRYTVMADAQSLQGQYDQAVATYGKALASLTDRGRLFDPALETRIIIGRAEAFVSLERFADADREIDRALRLDTAREGSRGISVARDLETAGLSRNGAGQLAAARALYQRALNIRVDAQGRTHPKVSEDLNELGTIAYFQNDPAGAEKYWSQSVALDQAVLGPDHPDVAATLNNLARVLVEQRKFRQALPLLGRSLAINLAQRDQTHDDLAFIFANLGLAQQGLGNSVDAEQNLLKALRAAELHKHRLLAPILTDLAALRCRRGDVAGGTALLDRAAPIMKERYPDDPWRSAWVDNTRGLCTLKGGDIAKARTLMASSAPILKARWPSGSLYGWEIDARRRELEK